MNTFCNQCNHEVCSHTVDEVKRLTDENADLNSEADRWERRYQDTKESFKSYKSGTEILVLDQAGKIRILTEQLAIAVGGLEIAANPMYHLGEQGAAALLKQIKEVK